jgi:hypothetical protein
MSHSGRAGFDLSAGPTHREQPESRATTEASSAALLRKERKQLRAIVLSLNPKRKNAGPSLSHMGGRSIIRLRGTPEVSNRLKLGACSFQGADIQYGPYLDDCENIFDWNLLDGLIFTKDWCTHTVVNNDIALRRNALRAKREHFTSSHSKCFRKILLQKTCNPCFAASSALSLVPYGRRDFVLSFQLPLESSEYLCVNQRNLTAERLTIIRCPNHFGTASRNCLLISGPAEDRRLRRLLNQHCFRRDYQEHPPAY